MRMSALFGANINFGFFKIYGVSAQGHRQENFQGGNEKKDRKIAKKNKK